MNWSSLPNLEYLDLSRSYFRGEIPSEIGNNITGPTPQEIGNLKNLVRVDMGHNNLQGPIPREIGNLARLTNLSLNSNLLTGHISQSICKLNNLNFLHLSKNSLNGHIPDCLCLVTTVDLSYNHLDVQIRNKEKRTMTLILVASLVSAGLLFVLGFVACFCFCKPQKIKSEAKGTKHGDIFSIWNYDGSIAYEDIIKATNDFDIRFCIGTGGYGSVYRAQLPSGKVVALKKLHRLEADDPVFDHCFRNEAQMLTNVRHKNIVKLYGFCLHNKCMFLVYEHMEKGSLFCALRFDVEASEIGWAKRVTIVEAMAHALSYLHHDCSPPIVHRDISSNNILLNSQMEAFVSDFGTARLLHPDSSNQTVIAGTYGYIAPETMMGRHPGELLSSLASPPSENIMLIDVLDPRLPLPTNPIVAGSIVLVATMAFACICPKPRFRPTM
ncbi:hypothetical protein Vadar_030729 [Vaccinium darrowii]|uniref:Uncharacterized protein n=1 Tax=Vaccinium darrowii TaxID=229202 RepID=A0ACB7Y3D4_9ERIC|nr:hypothetical protein Vadar_030729 [Vaccinium darrowii]